MKKIILFILLFPVTVLAFNIDDLYSENAIVYDMTDKVIVASKNSDEVKSIASLTKIATAIVAIENIENLDQIVEVKDYMLYGIPSDASIAELKVGDKLTYKDLLHALILPSGADAAHVLAYSTKGSLEEFVNEMNKLASSLNMNNTHFENVTGYEGVNHKSSASDVLKLLEYSLKNDTFKKVYMTSIYYIESIDKEISSSIERLKKYYQGDMSRILGSKTGYTSTAGTCLSTYFNSNGHEYISVTLKAPFVKGECYQVEDAMKIINLVDENYDNQLIVKSGTIIDEIKVNYSKVDKYVIKADKDIYKYLSNDYDKDLISYSYAGKMEIDYNTKVGSKLGKIYYYYNNELINESDVVLKDEIKPSMPKIIYKNRKMILSILFYIVFSVLVIKFIIKKIKRNNDKI